jgi:hypothetical protein
MQIWYFSGKDDHGALTVDARGANLPASLGPWQKIGTVPPADCHPEDKEARRLIREHGFWCFDEALDS